MDRNYSHAGKLFNLFVALRKESVDRNHDDMLRYRDAEVALRKESVDRNFSAGTKVPLSKPSLSARRAWIEMLKQSAVVFS